MFKWKLYLTVTISSIILILFIWFAPIPYDNFSDSFFEFTILIFLASIVSFIICLVKLIKNKNPWYKFNLIKKLKIKILKIKIKKGLIKNKKFIIVSFVSCIILFLIILLGVIYPNRIAAQDIQFNEEKVTIYVGETLPIEYKILPEDTSNKRVKIKSSDKEIVHIKKNMLTGLKEGTVTVTIVQKNKQYDVCQITVKPVLPKSISFDSKNIDIYAGDSETLEINFLPENTTDKTVKFVSSNPNIAEIEGDTLTGLKVGKTIIKAIHKSGIKTECTVNVKPVLLESMDIIGNTEMDIKGKDKLSISFYPSNVTDKKITWSTSNKNVISISNDGTISANKIGTATITAKHSSGITAQLNIEVLPILASDLSFTNGSSGSVYKGSSIKLVTSILPIDTTNKTITWKSDNPSIAKVNKGVVTGVSAGETTIRATTINNIEATYTITVKPTTKRMKVTIECYCDDYNSVGNEWDTYFKVNGAYVFGNSDNYVNVTRNGSMNIYTKIIEYDSINDIGYYSHNFKVSPDMYEYGFGWEYTIYVTENRGRYSGNTATWHVTYNFSPFY